MSDYYNLTAEVCTLSGRGESLTCDPVQAAIRLVGIRYPLVRLCPLRIHLPSPRGNEELRRWRTIGLTVFRVEGTTSYRCAAAQRYQGAPSASI
jgi:hypothetical protein